MISLNIRDDEVHVHARELTRLTGETVTRAILVALRERLERERHRRGADALACEFHAI